MIVLEAVTVLSATLALYVSRVTRLRAKELEARLGARQAAHEARVVTQLQAVQSEREALADEHARKLAPPSGGGALEYPEGALWIGPTGERFIRQGNDWNQLP